MVTAHVLSQVMPTQVSPVMVNDITWNSQKRFIKLKHATIEFTPSEYRLLFPLRHGYPVTYAELVQAAYQCDVDEKIRELIDKHIDNIRGKIRGSGVYVYCVLGYGYLLLPTPSPADTWA